MKDFINRTAAVIFFVGTITLFIILIVTFVKINNSEYQYMTTVGNNWNKGPITNIDPTGQICTGNFQRLITNSWPGTMDGCYCNPNIDLFYGPLRQGSCRNKRDSYLFCSTVGARPAMAFERWRGASICANRVATSYLDLTVASSANSCPFNMRSCGVADSMNNVLCVPSSTACPINNLVIAPTQPTDMTYTTLSTNSGANLYFSNQNTKGQILTELLVSELKPCADPGEASYSSKPFILDPYYNNKFTCSDGVGSFKYDDRYKLVDSYNYQALLRDNNVYQVLMTIPTYNTLLDNHSTGLYSRNYIGLHPSCLNDIRSQGTAKNILLDLTQTQSTINSAYGVSMGAMIVGIILFMFVGFYVFVFCTMDDKAASLMLIFPFILLIVLLILCSFTASFVKSYGSYHSFFLDQSCVDPLTYAAAQNFFPSMNAAKGLGMFSAFLSGLLLVVAGIRIVSNCF